jgi:hypothetical protein
MNEQVFNAPIPGASLTAPIGGRPWQSPPKYVTVEDAMDFYVSRFTNEELKTSIIDTLDSGLPVTTIANAIQLNSVTEGLHTIDIGILVLPIIMELIMYVGDAADIKYTTGLEKDKPLRNAMAMKALNMLEDKEQEVEETPELEQIEPQEEEPVGLMARRS